MDVGNQTRLLGTSTFLLTSEPPVDKKGAETSLKSATSHRIPERRGERDLSKETMSS